VREIVEAAGVTKPALYYHFESKEGVYLALFQETFAAFLATLAVPGSGAGSARERVLDLCDRAFQFSVAHLPLVRLMYAIYYGPPQGAPNFNFEASHEAVQSLIAAVVREGIESGEFKPIAVEDAMWAVVGALNIAMEVDLCHPEQSLGREGLARLLNAVFDGLATSATPLKKARKGVRP